MEATKRFERRLIYQRYLLNEISRSITIVVFFYYMSANVLSAKQLFILLILISSQILAF